MRKIITCIICVVMAFFASYFNVFGALDKRAEDVFYHHAQNIDNRIKIIKIDDKTMNQLGEFSTWNRDVYAELVEKICVSEDIRPAVIGFDILFSVNKEVESDYRFADACAKYNNVVTGFSYVFTKTVTSDENGNLIENEMSVHEKVVPYKILQTLLHKDL